MEQQSHCCRALPQYQSHKKVWALKIREILPPVLPQNQETDARMILVPEDTGYAPFIVSAEYMRKHSPQPGGYWVRYSDGYESWSPAEAFESGYTRIE